MLKTSYKLLFLSTLFMGTLISISSSSWLGIWMGLEINLLSFIPISMKSNNLFSSEASLKYFLTQALASGTLLFSMIFYFFFIELMMKFNLNSLINMIFSSTLMLKSGIAPFHFWFPNVMEGLNWINNFILMTWQKIAPLIILTFCLNFNFFVLATLFCIFIGAINGLNQTSLRKLMAYSSINHLGWMVASMLNNENLWKLYFIFYSFLTFTIILMFNNFKLFNLNQVFSFFYKNFFMKFVIMIPLLSLGGLPPFLGFFPKWIIIELMISFKYIVLIFFMVLFSLITLYFYLRLSYSSLLMNFNKLNSNNFNLSIMKNKKLYFSLIFISIFGLMFINLIFLF